MMEEFDPLIDCVDASQADPRVCRRSKLASCLEKAGHVLVSAKALRYVARAGAFFDDVPMLKWLDDVWPAQRHDPEERIIRTLEELMELAQTENVTREQMHALVDQVMDKPVGDREQELGGTLVTLSSYMAVRGLDGVDCFQREFVRCNEPKVIAKIQEKHKHKLVVSSKQERDAA
jgi:hypothetical protein